MGNYFRPHTKQRARIAHVCIACLHQIPVGDTYTAQSGFYDGRAFRNKYHPECMTELFAQMREFCTDEFMPGELEPPARLAHPTQEADK